MRLKIRTDRRRCPIRAWSHIGPTLVPPVLRKVRAGTYSACSDRVRRQGLEPRTRGLRVRCSVRLFCLSCCQAMLARAGSCHSVRSPASAPCCGYRVVPGCTGASEQPWSNIGGHRSRPPWLRAFSGLMGRSGKPGGSDHCCGCRILPVCLPLQRRDGCVLPLHLAEQGLEAVAKPRRASRPANVVLHGVRGAGEVASPELSCWAE